jgi:hypothetical protein
MNDHNMCTFNTPKSQHITYVSSCISLYFNHFSINSAGRLVSVTRELILWYDETKEDVVTEYTWFNTFRSDERDTKHSTIIGLPSGLELRTAE